ncbi:hypothetical protein [Plantactinospora sp. B5E13]|uniref:hypothetical protein n=1 Tax=Plantactinospora sp. B5E13 TaxID=3153758 RepID=UPI00325CC99E
MDHRDRGRGELARQERQDSIGWGDPLTGPPGDPYSRPEGSYRTPSRRRARHRGAPDPVDTYTPPWALGATTEAAPSTGSPGTGRDDDPWHTGTSRRGDDPWHTDTSTSGRAGGRHQRTESTSATGSGRRRRAADPAESTGDPAVGWRDSVGDSGTRRRRERTADGWRDSTAPPDTWRDSTTPPDTWRDSTTPPDTWRDSTAPPDTWRDSTTPPDTWRDDAASRDSWRDGRDSSLTGGWRGDDSTPGGWRDTGAAATTESWRDAGTVVGGDGTDAYAGAPDGNSRGVGRRRAERSGTDSADSTDGADGWRRDAGIRRDTPAGDGPPQGGRHSDGNNTDTWRRADLAGTGATGSYLDDRPRRTGRRRRPDPEESLSGSSAVTGDASTTWTDPARWRGERAGGGRRAAEDRDRPEPPGAAPGESARQAESISPISPAARWIRSPDEVGQGDSLAGGRADGADGEGRRRRRRGGDQTTGPDPVRRSAADRGRHTDSGSARPYAEPPGRDREAEATPWDRFGDTHTGMLDRVTDDVPEGRRRAPDGDDRESSGYGRRSRAGSDGGGRTGLSPTSGGAYPTSGGPIPTSGGAYPTSGGPIPTSGGGWGRRGEAARWDGFADTGQWDRFTDTTEWRRGELVGTGRDDDPRAVTGTDRDETFWSGTRLAEDDPRWMGIPDSAPKSPAVVYPPPRPSRSAPPGRQPTEQVRVPRQRTAGEGRADGRTASPAGARRSVATVGAPGGRSSTPSRRLTSEAARRRPSPLSRRLEDDLLDPRPSGPLSAVLYAAAWYAVPVLAMLVWVLTLDASLPVDCVPELAGGCESERGRAMAALVDGLPRFGAALATSLVIAALLRWVNKTWRVVTIGLSAAVVGGGLSTLLFSVISDQPLT